MPRFPHAISRKGLLLVLLAGLCWGLISIPIRLLHAADISARDITALRAIFTALFLLCALLLHNRNAFNVRLRDLWCFAGCGLLSITLFNICYFATLQLTTVGIAVILLYTSPIFVTLMSCFFFGEHFTRRKLLALLLVTIGCVLVSGVLTQSATTLSFSIVLLGLGSGFCYALYSIFGRFAQQRGYTSDTITLWTFIFASGAALVMLDWHHVPSLLASEPQLWLPLAGLVIFSTILPYCAYTAGLRLLPPSTAAIAATAEPVVGTLVGILAFHESLTFSAASGMVLIITAFFL